MFEWIGQHCLWLLIVQTHRLWHQQTGLNKFKSPISDHRVVIGDLLLFPGDIVPVKTPHNLFRSRECLFDLFHHFTFSSGQRRPRENAPHNRIGQTLTYEITNWLWLLIVPTHRLWHHGLRCTPTTPPMTDELTQGLWGGPSQRWLEHTRWPSTS